MMFRRSLRWLLLTFLAGCSSQRGRALVTVVFENETDTQCLRASARNLSGGTVNATPAALNRGGRDVLRIGLGQTADLVGEVRVTIARFSSADCSGAPFASETKSTQLVRGAATAMLEFRFVGAERDGGVIVETDAGIDGGVGSRCDLQACANSPGECETFPATGCQGRDVCRFTSLPAQTRCLGGVCTSTGTCTANVCSVLGEGAACDDGLACTPTSTCIGGVCTGTCASPPICMVNVLPQTCDTSTTCALAPGANFTSCSASGSQCLDGGCLPWLAFNPINFTSTLADTPYPTSAWNLLSPDAGVCDTVISTDIPMVMQGGCGTPTLTSTVNDAGVWVVTTLGLEVGPNARLHFVGSRPVQLVVIGDANIQGIVSVAPILEGLQSAGTAPPSCSAAGAGTSNRRGGGGGGFAGTGGRGGDSGGAGGGLSVTTPVPLRGGCPGGVGFRPGAGAQSAAGLGGGAIELIVADTLTMNGGTITASGGGGEQGIADDQGGGGGGSGGTVIIEGRIVNLNGGAVTANGGGGGEGGDSGAASARGANGPLSSAVAAAAADSPASSGGVGGLGGDDSQLNGGSGGDGAGSRGGGGGGGAVGVIFIRGSQSCTRGSAVVSGAEPMSITCT